MAILERPATRPDSATRERTRATTDRGAQPRARRTRRAAEQVPIVMLAIVTCVSVGYGLGTLVQFDRDWRDAPPVLVTSVDGSTVVGTPLAQALGDLLADSTVPVQDVVCDTAAVVGDPATQMCRARSGDGMVSILATGPASAMHIEVFSGT